MFRLDKFAYALKYDEKAIDLEPALANGQEDIEAGKVGKGLLANGQIGQPRTNKRIVRKAHALTQQAIALQGQALHSEAIEVLNQALQISSTDFASLYSLGISLGATGQKMAALDCFIKAAEASPHLAIGHFAKAQSYADIGLSDDALLFFDKAIEVDPTYTQAYPCLLYQSPSPRH